MDELPETLTLRGSRLKWIGYLLLALPLMAGGALMAQDPDERIMAGFVFLFFAACCLIFLIQIVRPGQLTLTREGFEQSMTNRKFSCRWDEVSDFGVYALKHGFFTTNKFVSFSRMSDEGKKLAELNRALVGATGQLGDTFGMKAEELAELMNAFRTRALSRK